MKRPEQLGTIAVFVANMGDRALLTGFLERHGHVALCPASADDRRPVDIVIADAALAQRERGRLLQWKDSVRPLYLPLLVLADQQVQATDWIHAGFDDVLRTPIAMAELGARVDAFLRLRRHSEAASRESDARLDATLERAPFGVAHCRADGAFLRFNRRFVEILGIGEHELRAHRLHEVPGLLDAADGAAPCWLERLAEGPIVREFSYRRPGGAEAWLKLNLHAATATFPGQKYLILTLEDMTERRRTIEALYQVSERLDTMVRSSPMPIWTLDLQLRLTGMNPAARELFGLFGQGWWSPTQEPIPQEVAPERLAVLKRVVAGETVHNFETRRRRPDGTEVHLSVSKAPLRDGAGRITGILAIAADITQRVEAQHALESVKEELELRVAERTAQLRETNQELEAFAWSVSHDLRAPLNAIKGFTELLLRDPARAEGEAGNLLLRVHGAAQHMNRLIDGLLALSRTNRAPLNKATVDLSSMAQAVFADLRAQAPEREVDVRIAPGLAAHGDPVLLRQVLENLLGNAWKYTSSEPRAVIELDRDAAGYYVRDNGAGFDQAYAGKLFKPFERLHSEREFPGVGLGLATVKRILARHGGDIRAEGRPGAGACFHFTLGA